MDFALQRSWFNQDHKNEEYKVFCPCGRSHKRWLEEELLVDFMKKDMKMSQLCRMSIFSGSEDLFIML